MVTSWLNVPNFFVKGSKPKEVKPSFHGVSPQHTKCIWENKEKITKDNNNFK